MLVLNDCRKLKKNVAGVACSDVNYMQPFVKLVRLFRAIGRRARHPRTLVVALQTCIFPPFFGRKVSREKMTIVTYTWDFVKILPCGCRVDTRGNMETRTDRQADTPHHWKQFFSRSLKHIKCNLMKYDKGAFCRPNNLSKDGVTGYVSLSVPSNQPTNQATN